MTILIITLLGLALRLILAGQSLWLDEAASVVIASLPIKTLFASLAGDFHPPLYYLLLKPWLSIAGQTEWLLRLPGILIGTLTIPALYYLVKQTKLKVATLAALFLALNPLHIYYSQELRMYSLSALLAVLTWYFLSKKKFFLFTLATIASFYTFYLSIFILASQWLYMLFYNKKRIKPFLFSNLIFVIFCLPWLPTLFSQLKGGGYLTTALPGWSALSGDLSLKSLVLIPAKFSLGRISILPKNLYYLIIALVLAFVSLLFVLTLRVKRSKLFLFWLFTPLVLAILVSTVTPILGYWRYIFLLPAFSTLLAIGISYLPKKTFALNLSFLILLFLFSNLFFITNPKFHRENWSSFAKLVKQKQDTLLIVNFTDAFAPLKFYLPNSKVFPTQVKLGQTRGDIDETLPPLITPDTTIFYLDYLSDLTSPDRSILIWLETAGLKKSAIYQFEGLGAVYEYQAP
ncbi:glycosyltransferase family 39 protein [Patescibacteria group bacterium]|nr:glycosyltransferase family 39 protein [Patescibacteria group bacterium]MBU1256087.1 glycosyltransferase family 39 protein [Patescibacteria group bacterium]MBU1457611.1 glycosyltransferase family 39 protein [Patescibacteria group bacterium]